MIIRSEQMSVIEDAAEEKFVKRLAAHLRENYAKAIVHLPKKESAVDELPNETLFSLVRKTIKRARSYDLTFESSISAFSALMFEVAPNFDEHSMSKLCLKDKNIEPNERLNEVLKLLTEEHWDKIRSDYDVNAWKSSAEETEESEDVRTAEESENVEFAQTAMNVETTETPKTSANANNIDFDKAMVNVKKPEVSKEPANIDVISFDETMMNVGQAEGAKEPVDLDAINFDETMVDFEKAKKVKKLPKKEDYDLDKTVMNFDPEKE